MIPGSMTRGGVMKSRNNFNIGGKDSKKKYYCSMIIHR